MLLELRDAQLTGLACAPGMVCSQVGLSFPVAAVPQNGKKAVGQWHFSPAIEHAPDAEVHQRLAEVSPGCSATASSCRTAARRPSGRC